MTLLEALQKVRPMIASGWNRRICLALGYIGAKEHQPRIEKQLAGECTYERWVGQFHPEIYFTMTDNDFRVGRLQWIDHMIEQELKGIK